MKLREQAALSPGMNPYVFIEWDKRTREADLVLGGGLSEEVHIPDVVERLRTLADDLVARQKGKNNG